MENLRAKLIVNYDLPGAIEDHNMIRLGLPKTHMMNPFYPGGQFFHYSTIYKKDTKYHWNSPEDLLGFTINPQKTLKFMRDLGACLPLYQRSFRAKTDTELAAEIFDNLSPMCSKIKL